MTHSGPDMDPQQHPSTSGRGTVTAPRPGGSGATRSSSVVVLSRAPRPLRWLRRRWLFAVGVFILLWLIIVPLAYLIFVSFQQGPPGVFEGWTLDHYTAALTTKITYIAFRNTIIVAGVSTIFSVMLAVLFAWLIERTDMPGRNVIWSLVVLPLAMPGILYVLAWTRLLSPQTGYLNVAFRHVFDVFGLHLATGPANIFSLPGLIFLDSLRGVNTIFLMIVAAFRLFDPSLEEAANIGGARTFTTLRRVTLPVLVPALLGACMYAFIGNMESFESALAVGLPGGVFLLSTLIYFTVQLRAPIDYGLGAVFAILFMVLMIVLLIVYRRIVAHSERYATVTGKGYRPRRISLGKWRYLAFCVVALYALATTVLPFLVMVWTSIIPEGTITVSRFADLTLNSYRALGSSGVGSVVWHTVAVTVLTATATTVLAFLVSWLIVRGKGRGRGLLDGLSFFPYAIPGITIAIALIFAYLNPPFLWLGIYGTVWILVLGLTTQYVAFGTRLMNGAVIQIHPELEDAAQVAGAGYSRVVGKVTLPLLLPAFAAAWVWVAAHTVRAFSIPLLLQSPDNEVIGVRLWEDWTRGLFGRSAALGVLLMLALLPLTLMMRRLIVRASGGGE